MESVDAVVVGAGLVGAACARVLAGKGLDTLVLERHRIPGSETSSRNSEVIHAGIYAPPTSLKARLCVAGNRMMYVYCRERGVDHRACGKLIVATAEEQEADLRRLLDQGWANGVTDLVWLSGAEARDLEPQLSCTAALWSPATGIVDSHGLLQALIGDGLAAGATYAYLSPVTGGIVEGDGFVLEVGGAEPTRIRANRLINAAGLGAQGLAAILDGFPGACIPPAYFAKGNYFSCSGRVPFSRLIYPIPEPGGLGIHLTLDLAGSGRFGPDVEWISELDYGVDAGRGAGFASAIRRYWPTLSADGLVPAYSGIRPKLSGPGDPPADFVVQGPTEHGVPGLVNLFGIESPGLTSCLAIADLVLERLGLA